MTSDELVSIGGNAYAFGSGEATWNMNGMREALAAVTPFIRAAKRERCVQEIGRMKNAMLSRAKDNKDKDAAGILEATAVLLTAMQFILCGQEQEALAAMTKNR